MALDTKILVVDDEPHIRRILQFLLEQEGFEVLQAENGLQALELLAQEKPELILLDVMMPEMDGFTVLQQLRANYETSGIPVIMLTANGAGQEKVKGLKIGANDYITKPFNHEELLLRMRNMLEAQRAQREANPLTGLPGNRAIEREVQCRLDSGQQFGFMYIDMDRFKGFNDYYGYSRGDQAITFLARILRQSSQEVGKSSDFIGHVGGDDFVVITSSENAEAVANHIAHAFARDKKVLFDATDFENGYLPVKTRGGDQARVALVTLTIALIVNADGRFQHVAQLSDVAAELKRFGKAREGDVVVKERRTPGQRPELLTRNSANEPLS
jgi:diguanylate cyclase (GGDEF)-like protein